MAQPLSSADINIFLPEISIFLLYQEIKYRLQFNAAFLILLTVFESLKVFVITVAAILMMSAKLATLGYLKTKVFWNKGYDIMIFVNDVTSKMLFLKSNYIVHVVMWPKFGNSSISMREIIITSIL